MFENSKLNRDKALKIVERFCIDIDATQTALLLKLHRRTVNRYFLAFRRLIYAYQVSQKEQILGVVEVDGGRGTLKQPVFGIYERNGSIYTELAPNCSGKTLQAIIRGKIFSESVILVDVGYDKYFRTNKTRSFDDIEAFLSFTKRRLSKFNGVKVNFELHLKECEWRYNKSSSDLFTELKKLIAKNKDMMV